MIFEEGDRELQYGELGVFKYQVGDDQDLQGQFIVKHRWW